MGASRKLQGEIDRVLKKVQEGVEIFDSIWKKVYDTDNANQKEKYEADLKKEIKKLQRYRDQIKTWIQSSEIKDKKVSASYEQALVDARKQIEREMERFKICEKETKTKAFSKEGLGQQPKTDPKEKAKSVTRDWLNNVVGELETQIDVFEAEAEGLSVKKGKTKPPRLAHLETSIARHKAHIMKLELILRLLDNDELSVEQVNDVKEFLDDYVERNQDDFEDFSDVDELYSSLPLDESLEELGTVVPSSLLKGAPLGLKPSVPAAAQVPAITITTPKQGASSPERADDANSQDGASDVSAKSPPAKYNTTGSGSTLSSPHSNPITANVLSPRISSTSTVTLPGSTLVHGSLETSSAPSSPSTMKLPSPSKEEQNMNFSALRPSLSTSDSGIVRERGSTLTGTIGNKPASPDMAKRITIAADDKFSTSGMVQPLVSPSTGRTFLAHSSNVIDGTAAVDTVSTGDNTVISSRVVSPPVSGMPWKPASSVVQNEPGQFRGRAEIAPDQRERFLERFQQVQQQGQGNLLGMPPFSGGIQKPIPSHQQNPLFQQLNSPGSLAAPQLGLGLGSQKPSFTTATAAAVQLQSPIHAIPSPRAPVSPIPKDFEGGLTKSEELQIQQNMPEDSSIESSPVSGAGKNTNEDDARSPNSLGSPARVSASFMEPSVELSPGQPLPSPQASSSLGVIGRRSVPDLGAVGEIPASGSTMSNAGTNDQLYNLQMLDAAYRRLPQPKDSERLRSYVPKNPAATPSSYPQVQAPIVNNPAFWERLGQEPYGADTLFFAFYYQQNTYQQYLAARELKKQSWRYHKKYNTWFQRHEEPKITTDEYEQGTYVYFDFHIANGELQHGWCQRIKTEFRFEYNYLEDEVV